MMDRNGECFPCRHCNSPRCSTRTGWHDWQGPVRAWKHVSHAVCKQMLVLAPMSMCWLSCSAGSAAQLPFIHPFCPYCARLPPPVRYACVSSGTCTWQPRHASSTALCFSRCLSFPVRRPLCKNASGTCVSRFVALECARVDCQRHSDNSRIIRRLSLFRC